MKKISMMILLFIFLFGCAGIPIRPALEEDIGLPPGKIEGDWFIGIRYPFSLSDPSPWKMTTEFPDFLEKLGYILLKL